MSSCQNGYAKLTGHQLTRQLTSFNTHHMAPFCSPRLCWGRRCGRRWCSACACSVVAMTWWPLSSWWMESRLAIFLDHLWTSDPNLSSPWSRGRIRIKWPSWDVPTFEVLVGKHAVVSHPHLPTVLPSQSSFDSQLLWTACRRVYSSKRMMHDHIRIKLLHTTSQLNSNQSQMLVPSLTNLGSQSSIMINKQTHHTSWCLLWNSGWTFQVSLLKNVLRWSNHKTDISSHCQAVKPNGLCKQSTCQATSNYPRL